MFTYFAAKYVNIFHICKNFAKNLVNKYGNFPQKFISNNILVFLMLLYRHHGNLASKTTGK